ncbi:MAG: hypothetical protein NVS9B3_09900 [Gemmatimonadaceae bacterium]
MSAPPITTGLLRLLPKAELHCHLDGSLRAATLLELAREYRITMPADDAESLGEYMAVRHGGTLDAYLRRVALTLRGNQRPEARARLSY